MIKNSKRLLRYGLVIADALIIAISYAIVSFFLNDLYHGSLFIYVIEASYTVSLAALLYCLNLFLLGGYGTLWKYAGVREYFLCCIACGVSFLEMTVAGLLFPHFVFGFGFHLLACALITLCCVSLRVLARLSVLAEKVKHNRAAAVTSRKNLLVIGAGEAAKRIVSDILANQPGYKLVGIIDDDVRKKGSLLFGVKVLGARRDIVDVCREQEVKEILLAIPSLKAADKNEILNYCNQTLCKVRILPSLEEIINFDELRTSVRDIQIEDLLARDPVKLDSDKISQYIKGKTVLVTGGGGSIGSELCRQIAQFNPKILYILDIYENNAYDLENELKRNYPQLNFRVIIASVRDMARLEQIFQSIWPEVVFHAAAHKHVPLMENNPSEAICNNVFGTMNVALCAHKFCANRFVLISTDKAVNPTNIMGATKRLAEMIIQSINAGSKTEYVAVRFGNVLGSNGSVVPLFRRQIENGGPVTLTHKEITRFFMTIPEAAQLVLEAASLAEGGEIFVLDMGQPVKIYDLAVKLIRLSGFEPGKDIQIEITGLREGEKLYEELLMAEEGLRQTMNQKIFVAQPMSFDWSHLKKALDTLETAADSYDDIEIRKAMRAIVQTYKPADEVNAQHIQEIKVDAGRGAVPPHEPAAFVAVQTG